VHPAVFIVEPQTLFVPSLMAIVAAAGGNTVRVAPEVDIGELVSLKVDFALLDLDYTAKSPLDGLAYFRGAAPSVSCILLTDDHGARHRSRYLRAGANAVLSKASDENETIRSLAELFTAGSGGEPRTDMA
jgi:DNA-binding NarL/FixJ family response regulator